MKRVWAIARLTFREGVRMKIVLVFLIVLALVVLRLPFALRGDETLAGRLQTFLDYSLGALGLFLGLATIFLSAWTLAGELKTRTLHLVATKPVSRFQILAGKWLGINLLNLLLIALCGVTIYSFARFIANQPEQFRRDRLKVRDTIWAARTAAMPTPPNVHDAAEKYVDQRIKEGQVLSMGRGEAIKEREKQLLTEWRVIQPDYTHVYFFENLLAPEGEEVVYQVRYKVRGIPLPPSEQVVIDFLFLDPDTQQPLAPPMQFRERSGDIHEFLVHKRLIKNGRAAVAVHNANERSNIHFEGADSLQVLYKVGYFEINFLKALGLILLRLAFLSAVGLFFSIFTSFPVACFCTLTVYIISLGMPWWLESIGANLEIRTDDVDPYGKWGPVVRLFLLPLLKVFFPNFPAYDGAKQLVDGTYIPYGLIGDCMIHTLVFGAILLLLLGWLVFGRREIAEVTVN